MRKSHITRTVLQCPEAWADFCAAFPTVVVAEDVGNKEVLIIYTEDQEGEEHA